MRKKVLNQEWGLLKFRKLKRSLTSESDKLINLGSEFPTNKMQSGQDSVVKMSKMLAALR